MDMREEFDRTNGRDHRREPPKGNNYIDPMAQLDWESFQKGWNQRSELIKIDASPDRPENHMLVIAGKHFYCDCGCNVFTRPFKDQPNRYKCNSCDATYNTEPSK